jgi:hypothetical protein
MVIGAVFRNSMAPEMKTITYRGGIVTFRIPAHWREEYAPNGGGTFYEDSPDSGTFRLEIITARAPYPLTAESAPDVLSAINDASSANIEQLPNGCALIRYAKSVMEGQNQLQITFWSIAQVVSATHSRIATFSYTILESQRSGIQSLRELELLDREVRDCIFSPNLGVTTR